MSAQRWSGSASRSARALWQARIDAAGGWVCCRCGRLVLPGVPSGKYWQPDHWPVPRELGGTETVPAHTRCNLSAGGKRGAAITNARRRPPAGRIETRPGRW